VDTRIKIIANALEREVGNREYAERLAFLAYTALESWAMNLPVSTEVVVAVHDEWRSMFGPAYQQNAVHFLSVEGRAFSLDGIVFDVLRRLEMTSPDPV
jgi:capsule polysaccharide modification protein KpsS